MNLLFRVLFASGCRSTHHKLAMDALRHIRGPQATKWQNLFLKYHQVYLDGSKAPDTKFKDFRNHVLHVRDNYWGGAVKTAKRWYDTTVAELKDRKWASAIYSAGVLSHYYTDPIQPFHTGQSEAESNIHRAAEWSITKSYDTIREVLIEHVGMPEVECPEGHGWLERMVTTGAETSNPYYEPLIERYDFEHGVKNPPAGLDAESHRMLAELVGHAQVGFARILERAFQEANVEPPVVNVTLQGFLATVTIPIRWITQKMDDAEERELVEAMFAEYQSTGKVDETLSEDDRMVRDLHAEEVLNHQPQKSVETPATIPFKKPDTEPNQPSQASSKELRFHLSKNDPVEDAPSIGPKTARRLEKIGIQTVADLLAADPEETSSKVAVRYITPQLVNDWQDQAELVCQIPEIRGHDAQILVSCDWREPAKIAAADPKELLASITPFVESKPGERIIRSGKKPDLAEVADWISWAGQSHSLSAAS
ncbi:DUF4332 domain-containing protein [Thalassoroseus pseudoceratinae]|uniref:DUF4332 domain-containing protein n=1 Tax=Thalassoroseus pseudoceratinae TaxID=2713176 RepID=UPI001423578F|nr:DUF4332 domain-containing protein [Thalassoroseus pseudoceratinae]